MPIPTEVVDSLPRPQFHKPPLKPQPDLQQAYADYDTGTITRDELVKAQDEAAEDSVAKMSQTAETLVTDGEQRASSFATCPIVDTLGGTWLADNLAGRRAVFRRFYRGLLALPPLRLPTFQSPRLTGTVTVSLRIRPWTPAIFDDGHHRQLPRLRSGPLRYSTKTDAYENFEKSSPHAKGRGME
ncbi:hypothetical protein HO173_007729 [Letharia columbiana]|uniref:Uncharacterized protein n=1 Tax=Letharia columbiana TaxID=112416 RepID=A0A8H6FSE2_9LECA|nr:uncharacterized protein HO173_007729 [Letharia columbiana]KAF6233899.1 hypothetical protein HO173_007729 [Letharia columbiana]